MCKNYDIFIGTYTDDTDSRGIYRLRLDADGETLLKEVIPHTSNPSWLYKGEKGIIYAISEVIDDRTAVTAYQIYEDSFETIYREHIKGSLLCHLSYVPKYQCLLGSCYMSGEVFSLNAKNGNEICRVVHSHKEDDSPSHPHAMIPHMTGEWVLCPDLGQDRVILYRLEGGDIYYHSEYITDVGEGPRMAVFHPAIDVVYVFTELSSNIHVLHFNRERGSVDILQKVSALPKGFDGVSYGADIGLFPNGQYLYASNRGADTIAIFDIASDGQLRKLVDLSAFGKWPRHVTVTSDGNFMIISNQKSDEIVVCAADIKQGYIGSPIIKIPIPAPSCAIEITTQFTLMKDK